LIEYLEKCIHKEMKISLKTIGKPTFKIQVTCPKPLISMAQSFNSKT
jgi:hypothetical protein